MKRKNNSFAENSSVLKKIAKILSVLFIVPFVFYVTVSIKDFSAIGLQEVNSITVEGELSFLNEEGVMQLVSDNITDGYFTLELSSVREVLQRQPWIKNVSLRRKWPAEVSVFIEEHKPIAFWNSDAYISESGDVIRPDYIDRTLNLPQLSGPEAQHQSVLKFINVLYQRMALLSYEIESLDLDDRRAWTMVLVSNNYRSEETVEQTVNVKLGRFDTEKRLQRFIRILPFLAADAEINKIKNKNKNRNKVIDMRYPNGFAVQMTDEVMAFTASGPVQAADIKMAVTRTAALQLREAVSND